MTTSRPTRTIITMALAVPILLIGALAMADWFRIGDIPVPCDHPEPIDTTALVLSGGPDFRRTRHAVSLYRQNRVARLVFSGAGYGGDSARNLAAEARRLGVFDEHILIEDHARSTADNFRLACRLPGLGASHRIAIVTDRFHAARAFATAQRQCPNHQLCSSVVPTPVSLSRRFSETVKWLVYQLTGRATIG